ncbi:nucleosome assembly protein 1-like 1 [Sarcoptes scabiei]|nr:nucleosome assembly protein 1-like 1 [Sarcoptes scabiei]
MVVLGKGVLRSMHVHKDYLCDLIPVDVVINTCILSAWYASTVYYSQQTFPKTLTIQSTESSTRNSDVFVVNCVSGPSNPITWDEIRRIATPINVSLSIGRDFSCTIRTISSIEISQSIECATRTYCSGGDHRFCI